ncbi:hypothetical protein UMM65_02490 [Aureibaculum sp. 2210JD6-5]|uniref:hypothetical protein n=1 Tax=Aureibaculum sp. 2210JD6-5 TaxID=3103957 RepID=UPI002AACD717|nr:hypothetical protein [Aureibaculum sp. 2210JD6-5]MDY7394093.1 hypothetical protein [Aureibaculum sp. 2210JD6-5]
MIKSYLKYIILFFGLVIIIDLAVGKVYKKKFNNINFGDYSVINRSLKSKSDLLILGSSRAMHHYNPKIFSENLKMTSYNGGVGGYGIFLNYAVLSERIKIKPPKIVILDISPNVIVDKQSYSKLNLLLPYYNKYNSFKDIVHLNPDFSKLELISNLYIYNSTIYDFIRSDIFLNKNMNFGFEPLDGQIETSSFVPFFLGNEIIDSNKNQFLDKIINLCKHNNIELIGVISPTYLKFDLQNKIISEVEKIFNKNNLPFFDYSNYLELYQKPEYFRDQLHMNNIGAEIFSRHFSKKIKHGI